MADSPTESHQTDDTAKRSPDMFEEGVFKAEKQTIRERRGAEFDESHIAGLALSGGGIRSASFALGILQAFYKEGVLSRFDYLSTVSGGGYIGSSLTWFANSTPPALADPETGENAILNYLRDHANYLMPGHGLNVMSGFAIVLRCMLSSALVYFPVLVLLMYGVREVGENELLIVAGAIAGVFVIASIVYGIATRNVLANRLKPYAFRVTFQQYAGIAVAVSLACVTFASVPFVEEALTGWWNDLWKTGLAAGVSTLIGGYKSFRDLTPKVSAKGSGKPAGKLGLPLAAALLVYGLLVLAYIPAASGMSPVIWLIAGAAAVLFGWTMNINYTSLHRMYRDRLMEAFLPDPERVSAPEWHLAEKANKAKLSSFAGSKNRLQPPYLLINTNVVLVNSTDPAYRRRGGDNFILSPEYCGSGATGWQPTKKFMGDRMTLATAMAISGAAVNPDTGVGGQGATRGRMVSFLMGLLNIRLGYWIPNPRRNGSKTPNYWNPGFFGLTGTGFKKTARYLELTDGGHFENLGLYELIRREAKLIVVSDATADPKFAFGSLGHAVERARADFGANIRFRDDKLDLAQLLPGTGGDDPFARQYALAEKGYAIGEIEYKSGTAGLLIYIKSTLTKGLPADIYGYKAANPSFPDQPTADQFFDEYQFEAYRELGYQLTMRAWDEQLRPDAKSKYAGAFSNPAPGVAGKTDVKPPK